MKFIHNVNPLVHRRKELRNKSTREEILLWSRLKNSQIGFKFRRQHSIGGYVVDFYCPDKKLAVEIDGPIHSKPENKEYDKIRTEFFAGLNIKVVRFTNLEVSTETESIVGKIKEALTVS